MDTRAVILTVVAVVVLVNLLVVLALARPGRMRRIKADGAADD